MKLHSALALACALLGVSACADIQKNDIDVPATVLVQPGSYLMGSPDTEKGRTAGEGPQQHVTIAYALAVGKYDVTRKEWAEFVNDTGYDSKGSGCYLHTPDNKWALDATGSWQNVGHPVTDNDPITCVNWDDANAYAAWLSKKTGKHWRLPSSAEWEYFARAGTTTPYPWGSELGTGHATCHECGSAYDDKYPGPVGSSLPNNWGLYDIMGNAWQWMADCVNTSLTGTPTDGSAWTAGDCTRRVLRGGSFNSRFALQAGQPEPARYLLIRVAYRSRDDNDGAKGRYGNYTFRLVHPF